MHDILLKKITISVHKPIQTPITRLRNQLMGGSQKVIISEKPVSRWSVFTGISQSACSWSHSHQCPLQPGCKYTPGDLAAKNRGANDEGQLFREATAVWASLNNAPFHFGLICWGWNCVRWNIFMREPVIGLRTVFQQVMAKKWFHVGQLTADGLPV